MVLTLGTNRGPIENKDIYTICSMRVFEVLKGKVPGDTISIYRIGGTVGGMTSKIAGVTYDLESKDEVALLIYKSKYNGQLWLRSPSDAFSGTSQSQSGEAILEAIRQAVSESP